MELKDLIIKFDKNTEINEKTGEIYTLLTDVSIHHPILDKYINEACLAAEIINVNDHRFWYDYRIHLKGRCEGLDLEVVDMMISYHRHGMKFISGKWYCIPSMIVEILNSR
jgi:hypothetical protein